jgi:hypothetical protein
VRFLGSPKRQRNLALEVQEVLLARVVGRAVAAAQDGRDFGRDQRVMLADLAARSALWIPALNAASGGRPKAGTSVRGRPGFQPARASPDDFLVRTISGRSGSATTAFAAILSGSEGSSRSQFGYRGDRFRK